VAGRLSIDDGKKREKMALIGDCMRNGTIAGPWVRDPDKLEGALRKAGVKIIITSPALAIQLKERIYRSGGDIKTYGVNTIDEAYDLAKISDDEGEHWLGHGKTCDQSPRSTADVCRTL
jgi:hypothetical protein